MQITIEQQFQIHERENNSDSELILKANKERFSNQCRIVYDALLRGEKLTTASALIKYGIGDLRRRIADLIENGVDIQKETKEGRFKEYFIELKKTA
jgi:hypothetical protein